MLWEFIIDELEKVLNKTSVYLYKIENQMNPYRIDTKTISVIPLLMGDLEIYMKDLKKEYYINLLQYMVETDIPFGYLSFQIFREVVRYFFYFLFHFIFRKSC